MKKPTNTTVRPVKRANKKKADPGNGVIEDADVKGLDVLVEEVEDDLDANDTEDEGVTYFNRGGGYDFEIEEEAEQMKQDGRYTIAHY